MSRAGWWTVALLLVASPLVAQGTGQATAGAGGAGVVHAVLFYSPLCPHCHELTTVELPPLLQRYGERLQLIAVNTMVPEGSALYDATVRRFSVPRERQGVPTLVVGSRVLVGTVEIPRELSAIMEAALEGAGIDWPDVPSLRAALAAQGLDVPASPVAPRAPVAGDVSGAPARPEAAGAQPPARTAATAEEGARPEAAAPAASARTPDSGAAGVSPGTAASASDREPAPDAVEPAPERSMPAATASAGESSAIRVTPGSLVVSVPVLTPGERFLLDPVANAVAVLALLLMVAALLTVARAWTGRRARVPAPPGWLIPLLATAGLGIAAYLAIVEMTGVQAVCGPVGHCNAVQQSPYALLFGVAPVGLLGVAGYAGVLALWALATAGPERGRGASRVALRGVALVATLFSAYLTFLEPFVIGATCAWCIASAVLATLILLAATGWVTQREPLRSVAPAHAGTPVDALEV